MLLSPCLLQSSSFTRGLMILKAKSLSSPKTVDLHDEKKFHFEWKAACLFICQLLSERMGPRLHNRLRAEEDDDRLMGQKS